MEEVITDILRAYGVSLGYLFGSHARGTAGPLSDIDVAVYFSRPINPQEEERKENEIKHQIQDRYKVKKVDIINLGKNGNVALGYNILFGGKALVVNDRRLQRALESKYLHAFEDTKYLRATQFNILRNKIHVAHRSH